MSSSAITADERVLDVRFTDDALSVSLRDGRVISVPLVWPVAGREPRRGERSQPTAQAVGGPVAGKEPRRGERSQPTAQAVGTLISRENKPRRGERNRAP